MSPVRPFYLDRFFEYDSLSMSMHLSIDHLVILDFIYLVIIRMMIITCELAIFWAIFIVFNLRMQYVLIKLKKVGQKFEFELPLRETGKLFLRHFFGNDVVSINQLSDLD